MLKVIQGQWPCRSFQQGFFTTVHYSFTHSCIGPFSLLIVMLILSRNREAFRVFVLLPLLPAFEGKIGSSTGSALRTILHYQYGSIARGEGSLCQRLKKAGVPDPTVSGLELFVLQNVMNLRKIITVISSYFSQSLYRLKNWSIWIKMQLWLIQKR